MACDSKIHLYVNISDKRCTFTWASRCLLTPNMQFPSISWHCVSWRIPGTFYEILMMSNLMTDLDFLAHWNNSPRVNMSLHLDTLFWFQTNQRLFVLRKAVFTSPFTIGLFTDDHGQIITNAFLFKICLY